MPAGPGESLLTTLFADIHYYFSDPAAKPPHHRFDRGSYVYLFHNATQRQSKLEIANAAGTPDQDAFYGYLNLAHIRYNYLQPNLVSLLINTGAVPDHKTWHLPGFDTRNEQKLPHVLHKLHALDIYLWTEKDATTLLNHLKNVIGVDRMEIKGAPPASNRTSSISHDNRDSISPVVQQLEKTAIGSHFSARSGSVVSAMSFPGPPTPAASVVSAGPIASPQPVVGYNPAAPAAPEPVTYREKTPPPEDDGTGTGLKSASKYETIPQAQPSSIAGFHPQQAQPALPSFVGAPQQYFVGSAPPGVRPGPPSQTPSFGPMAASTIGQIPTQMSPPPPPPQQQQQQSQAPVTQYASYPAHLQQQQQTTQFANYPGSPGYNPNLPPTPSAPPAYSAPLQSPGVPGQQYQQLQQAAQQQHYAQQFAQPPTQPVVQAPIGGFSSYNYTTAPPAQNEAHHAQSGAYQGDTHSQLYRPTEAELGVHGQKKVVVGKDGKPKLEDSFNRLEGKVSGFLGKLDKLW